MIWWTIAAGALIGWLSSGFETAGLFAGAIFGAPMGAWFHNLLRDEIERTVTRRLLGLRPGEVPDDPGLDPVQAPAALPQPVQVARPPAPEVVPARPEPALAKASAPEPALAEAEDATPALAEEISHSGGQKYDDEPSPAERLAQGAMGWLLGGNTIVRVGLVVLFIGLAFLVRLVVNAGLFPIEARLATVAAAGVALLGIGFWKRIERPDFGLHLQGAGVAVLYLTVFAAARIYEVMPPGPAFAFMILFAALGAALAVLQNSQTMALASFLGGYAVPFLLGGKAETPTGLFTYITVLNAAVMGIAWKRSWRPLNLLGFFATFILGGLWGFGAYEDRHFWICEAFLAVSVAIYLMTALLYAHNTPGKLGNFADSTLLFGTAIAGFGLQAGLVHDKPYYSAWSALVFGVVYLAVASWAFRRRKQGMGLLSESLLAIGVGFVSMAIPLALELRWVSVAWLLEGAGALWVGARQARWMPRAFGLLLQAAGAALALKYLGPNISTIPLANPGFIGPALASAALIFAAWLLRRELPHSGSSWASNWHLLERVLGKPWFLGGFVMACIAVVQEATRYVRNISRLPGPDDAMIPFEGREMVLSPHAATYAILLAVLGLMALADWFGRRHKWHVASWPGRVSLFAIGFAFLLSMFDGRYVVQLPDLLVWITAFALHFWMLYRADKAPESAAPRWNGFIHAMGVLGLSTILANALFYLVDQADLWDSSWAGVVFLIAGVTVLMAITRLAGPAAKTPQALQMGWPYNVHSRAYWWRAALILVVVLYIGALVGTLVAEGDTAPLPYLPLLNPVDVTIALVLVAMGLWRQMLQGADPQPRGCSPITGRFALVAGAFLAFIWINTIWIRTAHHWLGADWDFDQTGGGQVILTGFSILWTLMAMGLMIYAQRKAQRLPWLVGAALLAAVVAKLIFVDLSALEGFARIIGFIGVGVLMLLIGYLVPLPPRKGQEKETAK